MEDKYSWEDIRLGGSVTKIEAEFFSILFGS
jgi:hypothetical protein